MHSEVLRELQSGGAAPLRRIEALAPAKVNLFLGVHELEAQDALAHVGAKHKTDNIMHTISIADTLVLEVLPASRVGQLDGLDHLGEPDRPNRSEGCLTCRCVPDLGIPPTENICHKAILALADAIGRSEGLCEPGTRLALTVQKQTPDKAGLGGGSSDAAAALLAACSLWGADANSPQVLSVAQRLGADVPFFLQGGAQRMEGFGDVPARRYEPLEGHLVVVKPRGGVSTADAYREFDRVPEELPAFDAMEASFAMPATPRCRASRLAHAALAMRNNLAPAAERLMYELSDIREWLVAQPGVMSAQLSGSGSATFAICGTQQAALDVAFAAQRLDWYAMPAHFTSSGARIVEDRRALR